MKYSKALMIAVLVGLSLAARGDIRYDDKEGDYVQVTGLPCSPKVLRHVRDQELHQYYFAAMARLGGKTGTACATLVELRAFPGVPFVYVLFEDRTDWVVRHESFKAIGRSPL